MSKSVDNRIVSMSFDNKQFENNVHTTIKSLDDLKKGLKLDDAAKSLLNLDRIGRSLALSSIAEGVERISSKFTTLGIVGVTALQNITNSILNTGKQLVSSLTIDPVKSGLEEYETKMNAIQTILTNTEKQGTNLSDVNTALAELNEYSDKTIYNFAQMTDNIGKFTAAGLDLEDSVTTVKGLANVAAGFGVDATRMAGATYQMSQALSAGVVKLQDWRSMEQASMGGTKIQDALRKTAKEMGIVVDTTKSFRETLESGWLTSKVFVKTMDKMAKDESLIAAAQNVTTFTKLFDTMKESVGSGWAVSWEKIIGNKDESTYLLTSISNAFGAIVGPAAEARNNMLEFWSANGGRYAIIEAITNSFTALKSILKPITEAFRDIFPPMTGKRLVEISFAIRDLTRNFKIGEETSLNLKRTFKGLFAVIDIGLKVVTAIASGIASFIKFLLPAGNGILYFTGSISDFIVALDDTIKSSDAFNKAIKAIGTFLKPVAEGVKKAVLTIINFVKSLGTIDLSQLDSFREKTASAFAPLIKLGDLVQTVFSKIKEIFSKIAPIFIKIADLTGQAFNKIRENLSSSLSSMTLDDFMKILGSGALVTIALGIKKFFDILSDLTSKGGEILDSIKDILDGVKGSLEAYQKNLKANVLLKIAGAMAILTAAIIALTFIDPQKLKTSLLAMTVTFTELVLAMAILDKTFTGVGTIKMSVGLIALSTAILILSSAMVKFSTLSWSDIGKGIVGIAALSAVMVASARLLAANTGKVIKGLLGLLAFAQVISMLTKSVKEIGTLNVEELSKGLIGLGLIIGELTLFVKATKMGKDSVKIGLGLLILAQALTVLASAVKLFGEINFGTLVQGLGAITIMLGVLGLFTKLAGSATGMVSTAIGLIILSKAMGIFSDVIKTMGSMSLPELAKGLLAMSLALAAITAAMYFMPPNMVATGIGLLIVANSLSTIAKVLATMGNMTVEQIVKGLTTLGGALTIIAIAVSFMTGALPGAAALLVVSGALSVLAPVLKALGGMSLSTIAKSLLVLAGAFTIIGVAGIVLAPIAPAILLLAAAIAVLGIGFFAVGAGLAAFASGIAALAASGVAGAKALVVVVESIIGLIPTILKNLAKGLVEFILMLAEYAPQLGKAFVAIATAIINALITIIPKIVEAIYKLITLILATISQHLPKIVDAGMKIIIGLLRGIASNIKEIVVLAVQIIVNFLEGINSMLPKVIQAGFDMMISFINGLANSIRKNTPVMIDAIENLMSALIESGIRILLFSITGFLDVGTRVMDSGLLKGISNKIGEFTSIFKGIGTKAIDILSDQVGAFFNIGENIINGLIGGIKSKLEDAVNWSSTLATTIIETAEKVFGINSPSKVFQSYGEYLMYGLKKGIEKGEPKATTASSTVAKKVVKSTKSQFDKAVEWIDERKYYNQLSLSQELSSWEKLQGKYKEGSEERKKIDREVYRLKQELVKADYNKSIEWIDKKKYYNELSLNQELEAWTRIQKKYKEGDEHEKADREIYRIKQELLAKKEESAKAEYDNSINWIDKKKYYNELSLEDELSAWERVQKRYTVGSEERAKADREVYRIKKEIVDAQLNLSKEEFNKSIEQIDERKYYNQLTLAQELRSWKELQAKYVEGTEERKKADMEVYRVNQEIISKKKELEDQYYEKTKEVNEKLKSDIKSLNDEYDQALKSRTDALYTTYSLFDKLEKKEPIDGKTLISNLRDQVGEFQAWQVNISELTKKGLDDGLIQELEALGPKSLAQLEALNSLSASELTTYVALWRQKHEDAKNQSLSELADMKLSTEIKIRELNTQAETDLDTYKNTWISKTKELTGEVITEIATMNDKVIESISTNSTNIEKEFDELTSNIQTSLATPDWVGVGGKIVQGISSGIQSKDSINSLSGAIAKIVETINAGLDTVPTIRPVLDLSNVKAGINQISSMFSGQTLSASSRATSLAGAIGNRTEQLVTNDINSKGQNGTSQVTNSFNIATLVVREEADVKRVARSLYQMQIAGNRG